MEERSDAYYLLLEQLHQREFAAWLILAGITAIIIIYFEFFKEKK